MPQRPGKHISKDPRAVIHTVTLFDHTLTIAMHVLSMSSLLICYHHYLLRSNLAESGLAAVSGLTSAANKAKRDNFDLLT